MSMSLRCLNRQSVGLFPLNRMGPPIPSGEVYYKTNRKLEFMHQDFEQRCIFPISLHLRFLLHSFLRLAHKSAPFPVLRDQKMSQK